MGFKVLWTLLKDWESFGLKKLNRYDKSVIIQNVGTKRHRDEGYNLFRGERVKAFPATKQDYTFISGAYVRLNEIPIQYTCASKMGGNE